MRKVKVPTLETERLILRMWDKKDANALYQYAKNPNVGPNAGWKPHKDPAESRTIITDLFLVNMCWAIIDKKTGKLIGSIGLEEDNLRPSVRSKELGYSLSEDFWGKGIMTEAAKRLVKYSFEELKLDILCIRTGDDNKRSQSVIRKCGFVYEGTLRRAYKIYDGSIRETRCHSILKEEYAALNAQGHFD